MARHMKLVVFILLAGILFPTGAMAIPSLIGEVIYGGSWSQAMRWYTGGYSFSFLRVDWTSGSLFEQPSMTSITSGWTVDLDTPTSAIVSRSGNQTADFNWTWHFQGTRETTVSHWVAYDGNQRRESGVYTLFSNGTESWVPDDWDPGTEVPASPVPEPMTLSLLLLGGGFALPVLRKRRS